MKKNEYKCKVCKGVFLKEWSDEEARLEMERDFPNLPKGEQATVCDDCYKKVTNYYSPWSTQ